MRLLKRHFNLFIVLMVLLVVAVVSKSQTMTSMVESTNTLPAARAMESKQASMQQLIQEMDVRLQQDNKDYEAKLLRGILNFQLGKTDQAVADMRSLTKQEPSFHLAYLLLGDMLASKVMPVTDIGSPGLFDASKREQQLTALREEVYSRLRANISNVHAGQIPLQFLKLNSLIKTALLVDKSQNRIYVFERSAPDQPPHLLRDFYVSTGKRTGNKESAGDLRTPEGVYFITSEIPDKKLPEKYGIGAFPTNYPNALDRHLGKTGEGIWLHGTDRIYFSRPPMDSEGCVVMANLDLSAIRHLIVPGLTPIVITDSVQWVDRDTWETTRKQLMSTLEQWRHDWESMDVDSYLSHYAPDFWGGGYSFDKWSVYKRQVAAQKTYQKVALKNLSLFYYPREASGGKDIVVARFRQDYQSNNFKGETSKHLYLEREQGVWKIIYEVK
jgi:murein L,D-transpeptidase YafK